MEENNNQMIGETMESPMMMAEENMVASDAMMETAEKASDNETKNEKFVRLAEYRVNKLMTAIASLDKLHNRGSYEYTDEQVSVMFETIENQLADVKEHFTKSKTAAGKVMFTFNK